MSTPKVILDNLVYRQIMHWVNKSDHEVSGLGIINLQADSVLRVTKVMLLPQVNGPTHTDIEPKDAAKLLYQCRDIPGDLRFWWHSHVNMDVFWSGTDMDTIKKLGQGGWFLSMVFNKKREMRSAFYSVDGTQTPWGTFPLFQDKMDTIVEPFIDENTQRWDAEYTENVKERNTSQYFQRHDWSTRHMVGGPAGTDELPVLTNAAQKRPPGMSKREWKAHKKTTVKPLSDQTDLYGFTVVDWSILAQNGWDQRDVDLLFETHDATPEEILEMAESDFSAQDVLNCLAQGWTVTDFLQQAQNDTPVMDNADGGKYDRIP